jgi:hypothetical protein
VLISISTQCVVPHQGEPVSEALPGSSSSFFATSRRFGNKPHHHHHHHRPTSQVNGVNGPFRIS